jgi:hypothetical protein
LIQSFDRVCEVVLALSAQPLLYSGAIEGLCCDLLEVCLTAAVLSSDRKVLMQALELVDTFLTALDDSHAAPEARILALALLGRTFAASHPALVRCKARHAITSICNVLRASSSPPEVVGAALVALAHCLEVIPSAARTADGRDEANKLAPPFQPSASHTESSSFTLFGGGKARPDTPAGLAALQRHSLALAVRHALKHLGPAFVHTHAGVRARACLASQGAAAACASLAGEARAVGPTILPALAPMLADSDGPVRTAAAGGLASWVACLILTDAKLGAVHTSVAKLPNSSKSSSDPMQRVSSALAVGAASLGYLEVPFRAAADKSSPWSEADAANALVMAAAVADVSEAVSERAVRQCQSGREPSGSATAAKVSASVAKAAARGLRKLFQRADKDESTNDAEAAAADQDSDSSKPSDGSKSPAAPASLIGAYGSSLATASMELVEAGRTPPTPLVWTAASALHWLRAVQASLEVLCARLEMLRRQGKVHGGAPARGASSFLSGTTSKTHEAFTSFAERIATSFGGSSGGGLIASAADVQVSVALCVASVLRSEAVRPLLPDNHTQVTVDACLALAGRGPRAGAAVCADHLERQRVVARVALLWGLAEPSWAEPAAMQSHANVGWALALLSSCANVIGRGVRGRGLPHPLEPLRMPYLPTGPLIRPDSAVEHLPSCVRAACVSPSTLVAAIDAASELLPRCAPSLHHTDTSFVFTGWDDLAHDLTSAATGHLSALVRQAATKCLSSLVSLRPTHAETLLSPLWKAVSDATESLTSVKAQEARTAGAATVALEGAASRGLKASRLPDMEARTAAGFAPIGVGSLITSFWLGPGGSVDTQAGSLVLGHSGLDGGDAAVIASAGLCASPFGCSIPGASSPTGAVPEAKPAREAHPMSLAHFWEPTPDALPPKMWLSWLAPEEGTVLWTLQAAVSTLQAVVGALPSSGRVPQDTVEAAKRTAVRLLTASIALRTPLAEMGCAASGGTERYPWAPVAGALSLEGQASALGRATAAGQAAADEVAAGLSRAGWGLVAVLGCCDGVNWQDWWLELLSLAVRDSWTIRASFVADGSGHSGGFSGPGTLRPDLFAVGAFPVIDPVTGVPLAFVGGTGEAISGTAVEASLERAGSVAGKASALPTSTPSAASKTTAPVSTASWGVVPPGTPTGALAAPGAAFAWRCVAASAFASGLHALARHMVPLAWAHAPQGDAELSPVETLLALVAEQAGALVRTPIPTASAVTRALAVSASVRAGQTMSGVAAMAGGGQLLKGDAEHLLSFVFVEPSALSLPQSGIGSLALRPPPPAVVGKRCAQGTEEDGLRLAVFRGRVRASNAVAASIACSAIRLHAALLMETVCMCPAPTKQLGTKVQATLATLAVAAGTGATVGMVSPEGSASMGVPLDAVTHESLFNSGSKPLLRVLEGVTGEAVSWWSPLALALSRSLIANFPAHFHCETPADVSLWLGQPADYGSGSGQVPLVAAAAERAMCVHSLASTVEAHTGGLVHPHIREVANATCPHAIEGESSLLLSRFLPPARLEMVAYESSTERDATTDALVAIRGQELELKRISHRVDCLPHTLATGGTATGRIAAASAALVNWLVPNMLEGDLAQLLECVSAPLRRAKSSASWSTQGLASVAPWQRRTVIRICTVMVSMVLTRVHPAKCLTPDGRESDWLPHVRSALTAALSSKDHVARACASGALAVLTRITSEGSGRRIVGALQAKLQGTGDDRLTPSGRSGVLVALSSIRRELHGTHLGRLTQAIRDAPLVEAARATSQPLRSSALHSLAVTIDVAGLSGTPLEAPVLDLCCAHILSNGSSQRYCGSGGTSSADAPETVTGAFAAAAQALEGESLSGWEVWRKSTEAWRSNTSGGGWTDQLGLASPGELDRPTGACGGGAAFQPFQARSQQLDGSSMLSLARSLLSLAPRLAAAASADPERKARLLQALACLAFLSGCSHPSVVQVCAECWWHLSTTSSFRLLSNHHLEALAAVLPSDVAAREGWAKLFTPTIDHHKGEVIKPVGWSDVEWLTACGHAVVGLLRLGCVSHGHTLSRTSLGGLGPDGWLGSSLIAIATLGVVACDDPIAPCVPCDPEGEGGVQPLLRVKVNWSCSSQAAVLRLAGPHRLVETSDTDEGDASVSARFGPTIISCASPSSVWSQVVRNESPQGAVAQAWRDRLFRAGAAAPTVGSAAFDAAVTHSAAWDPSKLLACASLEAIPVYNPSQRVLCRAETTRFCVGGALHPAVSGLLGLGQLCGPRTLWLHTDKQMRDIKFAPDVEATSFDAFVSSDQLTDSLEGLWSASQPIEATHELVRAGPARPQVQLAEVLDAQTSELSRSQSFNQAEWLSASLAELDTITAWKWCKGGNLGRRVWSDGPDGGDEVAWKCRWSSDRCGVVDPALPWYLTAVNSQTAAPLHTPFDDPEAEMQCPMQPLEDLRHAVLGPTECDLSWMAFDEFIASQVAIGAAAKPDGILGTIALSASAARLQKVHASLCRVLATTWDGPWVTLCLSRVWSGDTVPRGWRIAALKAYAQSTDSSSSSGDSFGFETELSEGAVLGVLRMASTLVDAEAAVTEFSSWSACAVPREDPVRSELKVAEPPKAPESVPALHPVAASLEALGLLTGDELDRYNTPAVAVGSRGTPRPEASAAAHLVGGLVRRAKDLPDPLSPSQPLLRVHSSQLAATLRDVLGRLSGSDEAGVAAVSAAVMSGAIADQLGAKRLVAALLETFVAERSAGTMHKLAELLAWASASLEEVTKPLELPGWCVPSARQLLQAQKAAFLTRSCARALPVGVSPTRFATPQAAVGVWEAALEAGEAVSRWLLDARDPDTASLVDTVLTAMALLGGGCKLRSVEGSETLSLVTQCAAQYECLVRTGEVIEKLAIGELPHEEEQLAIALVVAYPLSVVSSPLLLRWAVDRTLAASATPLLPRLASAQVFVATDGIPPSEWLALLIPRLEPRVALDLAEAVSNTIDSVKDRPSVRGAIAVLDSVCTEMLGTGSVEFPLLLAAEASLHAWSAALSPLLGEMRALASRGDGALLQSLNRLSSLKPPGGATRLLLTVSCALALEGDFPSVDERLGVIELGFRAALRTDHAELLQLTKAIVSLAASLLSSGGEGFEERVGATLLTVAGGGPERFRAAVGGLDKDADKALLQRAMGAAMAASQRAAVAAPASEASPGQTPAEERRAARRAERETRRKQASSSALFSGPRKLDD